MGAYGAGVYGREGSVGGGGQECGRSGGEEGCGKCALRVFLCGESGLGSNGGKGDVMSAASLAGFLVVGSLCVRGCAGANACRTV